MTTFDLSDDDNEVEWDNIITVDDGSGGGGSACVSPRGDHSVAEAKRQLARSAGGSARALITRQTESSDSLRASDGSQAENDCAGVAAAAGDDDESGSVLSDGDTTKKVKTKEKKEKKDKKEKKKDKNEKKKEKETKQRSMSLTPKLTKRTTAGLGELCEQRRGRKTINGKEPKAVDGAGACHTVSVTVAAPAGNASSSSSSPSTPTPGESGAESEGEVYQFGRTYLFAFMPNGYANSLCFLFFVFFLTKSTLIFPF
jgi:hypothetical protein